MIAITRSDLGEIASHLLSIMEEKITSIEEIEEKLEEKSPYEILFPDQIRVQMSLRPSEPGTQALTISYCISEVGIPIEAKINQSLNYTMMIIKSEEIIGTYEPFSLAPFGNLLQSKKVTPGSLGVVKQELALLVQQ